MLSVHIGRIALFLHRSVLTRQTSCLQKVITFPLSQTLYKNTYIREKVSFAEDVKMLAWHCGAATEKEEEWKKIRKKIKKKRGEELNYTARTLASCMAIRIWSRV